MKTITKDWGTQFWISDSSMVMVMDAGKKTSVHKHVHHRTDITLIEGVAVLWYLGDDGLWSNRTLVPGKGYNVFTSMKHQLVAVSDCVIYEQYSSITGQDVLPIQDIIRSEQ